MAETTSPCSGNNFRVFPWYSQSTPKNPIGKDDHCVDTNFVVATLLILPQFVNFEQLHLVFCSSSNFVVSRLYIFIRLPGEHLPHSLEGI